MISRSQVESKFNWLLIKRNTNKIQEHISRTHLDQKEEQRSTTKRSRDSQTISGEFKNSNDPESPLEIFYITNESEKFIRFFLADIRRL